MRLFLKHLYAEGRLPCITPKETEPVCGRYLRRYEEYLRKDRGPIGAPFPVEHFHSARRSIKNMPLLQRGMTVA